MDWTQTAADCSDHEDCTVIVCANAKGRVAWTSHAPSSTHADCRANPAIELVGGNSTKAACEQCVATFTADVPS